MPNLFGRVAELVVDTIKIRDLDIAFRVEKDLTRNPNKAEIQVWNLNADHRRQLQELSSSSIGGTGGGRVKVSLRAGYPETIGQVFLGDLRYVYSSREKADWVTTIRSGDGDAAAQQRINLTLATPGDIKAACLTAAKSLKVGLGNLAAKLAAAKDFSAGVQDILTGDVLSGPAMFELERLLKRAGLEHSIQDGELQVTAIAEALDAVAIVLSPETGLLGSPEIASTGIVKAKALLQTDIFPGRKVAFRSASLSGFYRVEKVTYVGELAGKDWIVDLEARAL